MDEISNCSMSKIRDYKHLLSGNNSFLEDLDTTASVPQTPIKTNPKTSFLSNNQGLKNLLSSLKLPILSLLLMALPFVGILSFNSFTGNIYANSSLKAKSKDIASVYTEQEELAGSSDKASEQIQDNNQDFNLAQKNNTSKFIPDQVDPKNSQVLPANPVLENVNNTKVTTTNEIILTKNNSNPIDVTSLQNLMGWDEVVVIDDNAYASLINYKTTKEVSESSIFKSIQNLLANNPGLKNQLNIAVAEPNHIITIQSFNDPEFEKQWYLNNRGQNTQQYGNIDIPGKYDGDIDFTNMDLPDSSTQKIAVIDTGIDLSHPEFEGQIVDPTRFGYRDINNNQYQVIKDANAQDLFGHGTHVSGIIAAKANNGIGITGTCSTCKVMPVNVFYHADFNNNQSIEDDEVVSDDYLIGLGIYEAVDKKATVINLSLTTAYYSQFVDNAINTAIANGIIVVAAAGNDGVNTPAYPANYPGVISVASTNSSDSLSWFSNYGSWVDVAAPGEGIYSTYPQSLGGYSYLDGTSMASPIVAASAGILKTLRPDLNSYQLEALLGSGVGIDRINLPQYFNGRLNLCYLVYEQKAPNISNPKCLDSKNQYPKIENITETIYKTDLDNQTFASSFQPQITLDISDDLLQSDGTIAEIEEYSVFVYRGGEYILGEGYYLGDTLDLRQIFEKGSYEMTFWLADQGGLFSSFAATFEVVDQIMELKEDQVEIQSGATATVAILENDTITPTNPSLYEVKILETPESIETSLDQENNLTIATTESEQTQELDIVYEVKSLFSDVVKTAVVKVEIKSSSSQEILLTQPDIYNIEIGQTLNLKPLDNDPSKDSVVITAVTEASLGSIIFDESSITYTALIDAGTDTFSYIVSDGVNTATETITVNIEAKEITLLEVSPVLECVSTVEITGKTIYKAKFGYNNPNSNQVTITEDNYFSPLPKDRSQPVEFQSGRQINQFEVDFDGGDLVWILGNKSATASKNSTPCRTSNLIPTLLDLPNPEKTSKLNQGSILKFKKLV